MFAGIGGFRKAFEAIGGQCVFTSELDTASQATYRANFVCDHPLAGDIRTFTKDEASIRHVPVHDVLLAGFPCQPFSVAGVSKRNALGLPNGFACTRQGHLFFDLARIIAFHRPKAILLENVRNLVNHDKGKTFRIIRHVLEVELGYTIHYRIIDGRHWVPQHRQRIFIAGFRGRCAFDFNAIVLPDPRLRPTLNSILHGTGFEEEESPYFLGGQVAEKYTLSDKLWSYLQAYKEKHRAAGNGFGFGLVGPDEVTRTLSARYYKDGSEILIRQVNKNPRRLTPRECARLMGFDLPAQKKFHIPVSDTQAYRQFGNAVIVPVVEAVAHLMKPYIESPSSNIVDGSGF